MADNVSISMDVLSNIVQHVSSIVDTISDNADASREIVVGSTNTHQSPQELSGRAIDLGEIS